MSSVELSKLAGISAARPVAAGDHAPAAARTAAPPPRNAPTAGGVSLEVSTAAAEAVAPPVDAERVQQIRAALRDGSYPLVPTKIVDAMIAAQVSLSLPERN